MEIASLPNPRHNGHNRCPYQVEPGESGLVTDGGDSTAPRP
ncbi:hypothetical protein [Streptantibioticus cattleyicolor]|nr:hypothetical protein [Streptantibioticus cattleyicolor]